MTRYILLTAASALLSLQSIAQADYRQPLQNTFLAFDTTQDMSKKVEQSNKLNMIAKKWNDQWAPHYYNAYSKAQLSYMEKDEAKRDAYVDEAEKELGEAVSLLGKDNDETYVLAAMVASARMSVKPQSRWQKYGKIYDDNLEKAKELNADNPRIYYLRGTNKFFTPKMFGGGKKAALPYFEKAHGLYEKEQSGDIDKPYWGKGANAYFLAECKNDKE